METMENETMSSTKTTKSRWKKFYEKFNSFVLAMDYDPAQSTRESIHLLKQELVNTRARLDQMAAKQTPAKR